MGLQYGNDDDDLFDSDDEDAEESENDLSSDHPPRGAMPSRQAPSKARRLRIRPMTPSMAQKHPNVISILLTRHDGRQLVFVRK